MVIGYRASGMTPFVAVGSRARGKKRAKIAFVTCWPGSELQNFVGLQIAPAVGPELIRRVHALKRERPQDGAEHAHHIAMIKLVQYVRQSDGAVQTALKNSRTGLGAPQPRDRLTYDDCRCALLRRANGRQGGDRDAEAGRHASAGAKRLKKQTIRSATRLAKTSAQASGNSERQRFERLWGGF